MTIGVPDASLSGQPNFLQICQRFVRESRISRSATPLPPTVLNQSGQMQMVVDWVADAWVDLQTLHDDWRFMRRTAQFDLIQGQSEYTPQQCGIEPEEFGHWAPKTFRNYVTSVGLSSEIPMSYLSYDCWRDTYQYGAMRTSQSRPNVVTVMPNNNLGVSFTPVDGYSMIGDYYVAPVRMETDEEIPALPIQHNFMLIVYEAMVAYGYSEIAPERLERAKIKRRELLAKLRKDQLPL